MPYFLFNIKCVAPSTLGGGCVGRGHGVGGDVLMAGLFMYTCGEDAPAYRYALGPSTGSWAVRCAAAQSTAPKQTLHPNFGCAARTHFIANTLRQTIGRAIRRKMYAPNALPFNANENVEPRCFSISGRIGQTFITAQQTLFRFAHAYTRRKGPKGSLAWVFPSKLHAMFFRTYAHCI